MSPLSEKGTDTVSQGVFTTYVWPECERGQDQQSVRAAEAQCLAVGANLSSLILDLELSTDTRRKTAFRENVLSSTAACDVCVYHEPSVLLPLWHVEVYRHVVAGDGREVQVTDCGIQNGAKAVQEPEGRRSQRTTGEKTTPETIEQIKL